MFNADAQRINPELKKLVVEASRALACLDTDRLEELARSCQALNRELPTMQRQQRIELARQASETGRDMAVFDRVLEATRANLDVMNRLRELQIGHLEYRQYSTPGPMALGSPHGNN